MTSGEMVRQSRARNQRDLIRTCRQSWSKAWPHGRSTTGWHSMSEQMAQVYASAMVGDGGRRWQVP
jgi:hypothetical protein